MPQDAPGRDPDQLPHATTLGVPAGEAVPGAVRLAVRLAAPPEHVWPALTEPDRVAEWFGDLAAPLRPGEDNRLDFEDGDFFTLRPTLLVPARQLAYEWRFLGIGKQQRIAWTLDEDGTGTLLTVTDHDTTRTPAEAGQLLEGWRDFLTRLATHLHTGTGARYALRDDIDGAVDLPPGPYRPLTYPALLDWLPVAEDGFRPAWFFVVDDEGPRRFPLRDWELRDGQRLEFAVEIPGARAHPGAHVTLAPLADGTGHRLAFAHRGWTRLGLPDGRAQELRRRFTATWIASLAAARERAHRAAGPD
ncbi:SRPBCC domain-containing protein [Streptomyces sp. NPDC049585]|uniref:SRPBCC domain-containing protein n=1 Tax=Streptomyces sp. NPDC049585 TaxID=3155154 RepID=UPI0034231705